MPNRYHTTSKHISYTSADAAREAANIMAEHYGIKVASLLELCNKYNIPKEEQAEAYYGKAKTAKARKSQKNSLDHLIKKYGTEVK